MFPEEKSDKIVRKNGIHHAPGHHVVDRDLQKFLVAFGVKWRDDLLGLP